MAVGDVILRDDLDITAFAIASYMVAGRYRLQDNSANVVGGVNDEYFFHRVPSHCRISFSVELRQILRKFLQQIIEDSARPVNIGSPSDRAKAPAAPTRGPPAKPLQRSARPARVRAGTFGDAIRQRSALLRRNQSPSITLRRLDNGVRADWSSRPIRQINSLL